MRNERFLREFDWNLIFIFQVILEAGGITAASQRLLRTQPSVSNALNRLETSLGHRLIHRTRGTFELTDYGRLFHEEALRVLRGVERISDLAGDASRLNGMVRIQIANHLDCPVLNNALEVFHERQPQVKLEIESAPSGIIIDNVRHGRATIGFCILNKPQSGLSCHHLSSGNMGFYCGRRHPLFGRENLTLDDLDEHNYISYESDHLEAGLDAVARIGLGNRFRDNRIASSASDEEVLRLIEAGIGFGPLNVSMGTLYVNAGRLWPLPPYEHLPVVNNYLITSPHNRLTLEEISFVEVVEATLENALED